MKEVPNIQTYRFTRIVFGVSSSSFLLNAAVKHYLELYSETYPQFVQLFLRSVYIDDVFDIQNHIKGGWIQSQKGCY